MRLIDADALLKHEIEADRMGAMLVVGKGYILSAPEVDAVPVVRGEWIHGCTDGAGTEFCYCSACGEDALKDKGGYTEFSRYCPNCGAKMDGEKEGV
jgi:hypothetical protein